MSFFFVRGAKSKENPKEEPKAPQAGQSVGCRRGRPGQDGHHRPPPGEGPPPPPPHPFPPRSPNARVRAHSSWLNEPPLCQKRDHNHNTMTLKRLQWVSQPERLSEHLCRHDLFPVFLGFHNQQTHFNYDYQRGFFHYLK